MTNLPFSSPPSPPLSPLPPLPLPLKNTRIYFLLKSSPILPSHSQYIMTQAFAAGMDQVILQPPIASFHQYHAGSWGSAGGITDDVAKRPMLKPRKYIEDGRDMMLKQKPVTLWNDPEELGCNNAYWGFGNVALHEVVLHPQSWNLSRNSMRVV